MVCREVGKLVGARKQRTSRCGNLNPKLSTEFNMLDIDWGRKWEAGMWNGEIELGRGF
jgi:hypothetical protein